MMDYYFKPMALIYILLIFFSIYMINKNHVFNNLIIIEYMILTILMIFFVLLLKMKMEFYLIIYFLIISIAESIIGLSILIAMMRTHNNDYIKSLSIMKF